MDFIKKNSAWIALAGLALSVYLYYKLVMSETTTDSNGTTSQFAGKISNTNPINA